VASWRRRPDALADTWVVFRQAGVGYPPLWHPGSFARPRRQPRSRWNSGAVGEYAQYFSAEADAAWCELIRWHGVRTDDEREQFRSNLYQCWITETEIADLETFDKINACGLDPELFIADDYGPCNALAAEFVAAGFRGLVTPSAAVPDVVNLTLFGHRHELDRHGASGRTNPRPDLFIPLSIAAASTAPPPHTLCLARKHGDPHLGYEHSK
jgi:RES domain-containing protein